MAPKVEDDRVVKFKLSVSNNFGASDSDTSYKHLKRFGHNPEIERSVMLRHVIMI